MSLNSLHLYRRHFRSGKCEGAHRPDSRTYEGDELRRKHKKCMCPIYVSGTLCGVFDRKNTGAFTWEDAKAIAAEYESAQSWTLSPTPVIISAPLPPIADEITGIAKATEAFLAHKRGRGIADSTHRKYRTLVNQFRAFTDSRAYRMLDQITTSDMDVFYGQWKDGRRAKGKKLERLKGMFAFWAKRKLIDHNPAEDLEAPIGAGAPANKMPL